MSWTSTAGNPAAFAAASRSSTGWSANMSVMLAQNRGIAFYRIARGTRVLER